MLGRQEALGSRSADLGPLPRVSLLPCAPGPSGGWGPSLSEQQGLLVKPLSWSSPFCLWKPFHVFLVGFTAFISCDPQVVLYLPL